MAEHPIDADAETPAKNDLIVGVHTVIDSADSDSEDDEESQNQGASTSVLVCVVISAEQIPHRKV